MDLKREFTQVDLLFMAYNFLLAGVWLLRAGTEPVMPLMVCLHALVTALLVVKPRTDEGSRWPRRILEHLSPYLMWVLAWSEIGWLYRLTQPVVHDGGILALDRALFGFHLNQELSTLLPWEWLASVMGFSYLSYYLLILGPPVVLAFLRRERELSRHTLGLMSTYLACFLVYLLMPVLGPREVTAAAGEVAIVAGGAFETAINTFFAAGDSPGTAFPSSHCAASVAAALLVGRHFGRIAGRLALAWAGFIVISTIYTNNHYAVDAVAGVGLAVLVQTLVIPGTHGSREKMDTEAPGLEGSGINRSCRREKKWKGGWS
jgi:membrane-associated phospholipid phosphatase